MLNHTAISIPTSTSGLEGVSCEVNGTSSVTNTIPHLHSIVFSAEPNEFKLHQPLVASCAFNTTPVMSRFNVNLMKDGVILWQWEITEYTTKQGGVSLSDWISINSGNDKYPLFSVEMTPTSEKARGKYWCTVEVPFIGPHYFGDYSFAVVSNVWNSSKSFAVLPSILVLVFSFVLASFGS